MSKFGEQPSINGVGIQKPIEIKNNKAVLNIENETKVIALGISYTIREIIHTEWIASIIP